MYDLLGGNGRAKFVEAWAQMAQHPIIHFVHLREKILRDRHPLDSDAIYWGVKLEKEIIWAFSKCYTPGHFIYDSMFHVRDETIGATPDWYIYDPISKRLWIGELKVRFSKELPTCVEEIEPQYLAQVMTQLWCVPETTGAILVFAIQDSKHGDLFLPESKTFMRTAVFYIGGAFARRTFHAMFWPFIEAWLPMMDIEHGADPAVINLQFDLLRKGLPLNEKKPPKSPRRSKAVVVQAPGDRNPPSPPATLKSLLWAIVSGASLSAPSHVPGLVGWGILPPKACPKLTPVVGPSFEVSHGSLRPTPELGEYIAHPSMNEIDGHPHPLV